MPTITTVRKDKSPADIVRRALIPDDLSYLETTEFGREMTRLAAEIAAEARAKRLLITHFSSRYTDVRQLVEEARSIFPETFAAEDLAEFEV